MVQGRSGRGFERPEDEDSVENVELRPIVCAVDDRKIWRGAALDQKDYPGRWCNPVMKSKYHAIRMWVPSMQELVHDRRW